MTDKYYMSGIYSPELHYHPALVKVLPLVRELNYKYGLKVASKVTKNLQYSNGNEAVLMSNPAGFNVCAVWTAVEDGKTKYFLYSPHIIKSRGSDQNDKSTISGKTVGIVTGLLNKYNGIPNEQTLIRQHLSVTQNMFSMIHNSVKLPDDVPSRYSVDEDTFSQLINFVAHHMKIGENPNCEAPYVDRTMIEKWMKGYENMAVVKKERDERINKIFGGPFLAVGAYGLKVENGNFIPGVAGVLVADKIPPNAGSLGSSSTTFSVVKPFHPVFDFEDLIAKYPETMTSLMIAKMRMESRDREIKLGFAAVEDHYEECVPYCSYYMTRNAFNMSWFVIPIEVPTDAL